MPLNSNLQDYYLYADLIAKVHGESQVCSAGNCCVLIQKVNHGVHLTGVLIYQRIIDMLIQMGKYESEDPKLK